VLFDQNRARDRVVPPKVMEKLLSRWEVPDATEAHEVVHVY
jgi:tRNA uridine 5-carbamoylmethylation protein Kti12